MHLYFLTSIILLTFARAKNDLPKTEPKLDASPSTGQRERTVDSFVPARRGGRDLADRKDNYRPSDGDKVVADTPNRGSSSSWRNNNNDYLSRTNRDSEKPLEQQQQQPRLEPETWRKPPILVEEPPKPQQAPPGAPRFGKGASALVLAQAFSKSVSSSGSGTALVSQGSNLPGRQQQVAPFSRLTDNNRELYSANPHQRHINGY
ncbi:hypothetical protein ACMD2_26326 [Ananas comosus]|uniref:Uncharacterized protein n=1 Tax=Ananas comosus TaxID=4615 RepID=A0A199V9C3_ANACO|nr:hypothetical protein ACMD2_26326 [Ananas comosus]